MRPDAKVWTTDVCVPISRFPECVAATQRDIEASSLQAPIVGHAGDGAPRQPPPRCGAYRRAAAGNFHVFFLIDTSRPEEMAEAIRLNRRMVHRAIEMEGTCTGEHGVGVGKKVTHSSSSSPPRPRRRPLDAGHRNTSPASSAPETSPSCAASRPSSTPAAS